MTGDSSNKARKSFRINTAIIIEIIALFAFISYYYLSLGFNNKELVTINYTPNEDILNYKVYIKDDYKSLYGEEYLNQGLTYISDLIDYIDVDFDYDLVFDKKLTGSYYYRLVADTGADINKDNVNDWHEEKVLYTSDPIIFKDDIILEVHENVKLNYSEYQEKMINFKSTAGSGLDVTSQVDLKLELFVKDIVDDDIEGTQEIKAYAKLTIPLVDKNSDISFTEDISKAEGKFEKIVTLQDLKFIIFDFIGFTFAVLAVCLVVVIILDYVGLLKGISKYNRTLRKILKTYDSIIVSSNTMPDLKEFEVVKVNNMQELLDAHSEVRMPINYIEEIPDVLSKFILIDGKMAWVYILEDEKAKRL